MYKVEYRDLLTSQLKISSYKELWIARQVFDFIKTKDVEYVVLVSPHGFAIDRWKI